jgi:hypothetical protein
MAVPIALIISAAAPLLRDLIMLIIEAAQASKQDEVTEEQLDAMLTVIDEKNDEVQELVRSIRRERAAMPVR